MIQELNDYNSPFFPSLTDFFPVFSFNPPEKIRKFSWCFQGDQNGTFERNELKTINQIVKNKIFTRNSEKMGRYVA